MPRLLCRPRYRRVRRTCAWHARSRQLRSRAPAIGRAHRADCIRQKHRPAGCRRSRTDARPDDRQSGSASSGTRPPAGPDRRTACRRGHRPRPARSHAGVLPLASTGTRVSSPCIRSAASTWAAIRSCKAFRATLQAPTWSARVDRLRSTRAGDVSAWVTVLSARDGRLCTSSSKFGSVPFARVAVALPVQRLVLPVLLEQDHRQQVGTTGEGGSAASLWGRGAYSRFDGRDGDLSLDGEVTSAMIGTDWTSASRLDGRGHAGPFAGRRQLPGPGGRERRRQGREHADRRLPLRALHGGASTGCRNGYEFWDTIRDERVMSVPGATCRVRIWIESGDYMITDRNRVRKARLDYDPGRKRQTPAFDAAQGALNTMVVKT